MKISMRHLRSTLRGLSIFETGVIVVAIGLLAAIAAPVLQGPDEEKVLRTQQGHARELASAFHSGKQAGVTSFIYSAAGAPHPDLESVVGNIVLGGTPETGFWQGRYFGVPKFSNSEIRAASTFLSWDPEKTNLLYTGPPALPDAE